MNLDRFIPVIAPLLKRLLATKQVRCRLGFEPVPSESRNPATLM